MNNEAWLGFNAFDSRKITGKDTIDFIAYRQLIAVDKEGRTGAFSGGETLGRHAAAHGDGDRLHLRRSDQ